MPSRLSGNKILVIAAKNYAKLDLKVFRSYCVESVQIRSFFGPNTGKDGPEKTPYLNFFHAASNFA